MFSHSLLFLYCTVPFSTNHTAHATVIRLNHECIQYTAETETETISTLLVSTFSCGSHTQLAISTVGRWPNHIFMPFLWSWLMQCLSFASRILGYCFLQFSNVSRWFQCRMKCLILLGACSVLFTKKCTIVGLHEVRFTENWKKNNNNNKEQITPRTSNPCFRQPGSWEDVVNCDVM